VNKDQFASLCAMMYVDPAVALENERIICALRDGAHEDEIAEILEAEF
jgi:hypothetical protein